MSTKSPAKKKKKAVQMVIAIGDNSYRSEGDTVADALAAIKPTSFLGFGSVRVTVDGVESAIPLRINKYKLERIFSNKTDMALFAKRIQTLL